MKETVVERRLIKEVRALGGVCMKVMPVVAGYPDRLVLLPGGRLFLVETKAPDGEVRPAQRVFIDRAAAIGISVALIWTTEQVTAWVLARKAELPLGEFRDEVQRLAQNQSVLEDPFSARLLSLVEKANGEQ